jgi:NADH-quinone oxidoreductase subunit M
MLAIIGASGMVLGAWYMLSMLRQVVFGEVREPTRLQDEQEFGDLDWAEWLAIALPLALCFALGVYPNGFLHLIRPDLEAIANLLQRM